MTANKKPNGLVTTDSWKDLRQATSARIAIGRSGVSIPTGSHLDFQLAHARARNAVHHELDSGSLRIAAKTQCLDLIELQTAAETRAVYLQRPDKGRQLSVASAQQVRDTAAGAPGCDVAFVIGDGLSALAIEKHAAAFLAIAIPAMRAEGWRIGPTSIVRQARVGVGDEIGQLLQARLVVVLIGERPGLSSPDSLGIYMTFAPRVGLTDEARNCISNVRAEGMSYAEAAHKLIYLIGEAFKRGLSGVLLKDESEALVSHNAPDTALPSEPSQ